MNVFTHELNNACPQEKSSELRVPSPVRRTFVLPNEHGASVSLVLSAVLAIAMSGGANGMIAETFVMTLIWLSLHRPIQVAAICTLGSIFAAAVSGTVLSALPVLAMALGLLAFRRCGSRISVVMKQTLGMTAVAALPLFSTVQYCQLPAISLARISGFIAATLLSTAVVQAEMRSTKVTPVWALSASFILFCLLVPAHSLALVLLLLPFIWQCFWLHMQKRANFKLLGMIEAVSMTWVTLVLVLMQ